MLAPIFVDIFIRMGANIALKWNLPKMKNGGLIKDPPLLLKPYVPYGSLAIICL